MSAFWRYWLLQIPGWILLGALLAGARSWFDLRLTTIFLIFAVWLVKDAAIYPWLRKHYELREDDSHDRLVGATGVAQESLDPDGYVKLGGELWRARVSDEEAPAKRGDVVIVDSVDGLVLNVRNSTSRRAPR